MMDISSEARTGAPSAAAVALPAEAQVAAEARTTEAMEEPEEPAWLGSRFSVGKECWALPSGLPEPCRGDGEEV